MTGLYVRIERDHRWQSLEIETLTDAELETFTRGQPVEKGWPWAIALAEWIHTHVEGVEEWTVADVVRTSTLAPAASGWQGVRLLVGYIRHHVVAHD